MRSKVKCTNLDRGSTSLGHKDCYLPEVGLFGRFRIRDEVHSVWTNKKLFYSPMIFLFILYLYELRLVRAYCCK